jgi:site-specific DNA-methyltransferase (adenine-specific)
VSEEEQVNPLKDFVDSIIHGECLEVMNDIPDDSVDMVLVDLPYGITQNRWDSEIPLDSLWKEYLRIAKDNAVFCFTASQPFTSILVMSNVEMFRHEWIWIKNRGSNFANTNREPMKEHESIIVFSRGRWTYNRQMQERTGSGTDRIRYRMKFETNTDNYNKFIPQSNKELPILRVPSSWQKFNTEVGLHPTQKPVSLFEYLINTYTNEGDVVLDNCIGSGTTAVACINTDRHFIGIELELRYVEISRCRARKAMNDRRQRLGLDAFK